MRSCQDADSEWITGEQGTHFVPEIQNILTEPFSMYESKLMMCVGCDQCGSFLTSLSDTSDMSMEFPRWKRDERRRTCSSGPPALACAAGSSGSGNRGTRRCSHTRDCSVEGAQ